jgi:hypothetical protein
MIIGICIVFEEAGNLPSSIQTVDSVGGELKPGDGGNTGDGTIEARWINSGINAVYDGIH